MSAIVAELQVRRIVAEVESTGRIARVVTILVGPGGSGGGGTSAIPVSLMVLGEGDIATIEADMVGNTPAFSGYVMVGYSVLSTSAGVPLASVVGETVAGSGPGLYTWDGTNLTFDRVTVPGDVLAVALTSWVTASPAGLFNGVAFVVDQGPSNPPLAVFQVGAADLVGVDASGFAGNLTSGATDVQLLAAEVDALTLGGGGGIPLSSIGLLDGERNRGYWDPGVADYAAGDVVSESGVWLAVTPATGVPPADPAWTDVSARAGLTVELGAAASASGVYSSAIGLAASASGYQSSAIGVAASASGDGSSAIGGAASATGVGSSAIGVGASATGDYSSAIGVGASASGDGDVNLSYIVTGHVDWSGSPTPDGLVLTPGFADLPVTADATDPATDRKRLIARTDGLYVRDETGTEVGPLGAGGGGGSGDVVGPASATDGAVALFDGTTGKLLKNGSVLGTAATADTGTGSSNVILGNDARLSDARTPTTHNHAASEITSGTIAQARLGTGSGGAGTKVLYDDQTYKTPSAGVMPQFPRVSGMYYSLIGTSAGFNGFGLWGATGKFLGIPMWLPAGSYDRLGVNITAVGTSTWRIGVYPANSTTLRPDGQTLMVDSGAIDMSLGTGMTVATVSLTIPTSGVYWVCALVTARTSDPSVWGFNGNNGLAYKTPWLGDINAGTQRPLVGAYATGVATGSMPATCPTTIYQDILPQLYVRAT